MKDNELRAVVLRRFYECRAAGRHDWKLEDLNNEVKTTPGDFYRICDQLAEHKLIEWQPMRAQMRGHIFTNGGLGQITAKGVDVIEGTVQSPISISVDHSQTVTIHGSNNIIGNNNQLSLESVNSEISRSNFSEPEKVEAKSLWQKVCENKILNTVVGSVFSAATKHALETTTQTK
jgi:hypothetical protein